MLVIYLLASKMHFQFNILEKITRFVHFDVSCTVKTHLYYCLLFYRLVRLGSPYVNTMIVAGAIIFYMIVILFGIDENVALDSTVNGLCHARIWLVAIGFSLLYGTIFAKTWRIHYIFNYAKPNTKFVSV